MLVLGGSDIDGRRSSVDMAFTVPSRPRYGERWSRASGRPEDRLPATAPPSPDAEAVAKAQLGFGFVQHGRRRAAASRFEHRRLRLVTASRALPAGSRPGDWIPRLGRDDNTAVGHDRFLLATRDGFRLIDQLEDDWPVTLVGRRRSLRTTARSRRKHLDRCTPRAYLEIAPGQRGRLRTPTALGASLRLGTWPRTRPSRRRRPTRSACGSAPSTGRPRPGPDFTEDDADSDDGRPTCSRRQRR